MSTAESPRSEDLPRKSNGVSFDDWRAYFFADAQTEGILHNAEQLGDTALRLFWEQGVPPTVRAVLASADGYSPRK